MEKPAFTLGVEEEFQIIDPDTRELRSHVQEILEEGRLVLKERVKPEMHQSVIEIGTGICKNIQEVRQDVGEMRTEIIRLSKKTGMPEYFETPAEFDEFVRILVDTNCIDNGKKIWWDVRPHPFFETIEFRVCDVPMRLEETVTLAALFQAICAKLYKLRLQNQGFRRYRRALILENKWRASRYGIEGKLIDFGKQVEVPFSSLVAEMLEFVDDVVDELGSRREVEAVNWILENGTGADRQLRVYETSGGDLKKVVDYICEETETGLPIQTPLARTAS
jgi:carboxylate-amine ligase